jgi:hypothetical protein
MIAYQFANRHPRQKAYLSAVQPRTRRLRTVPD